MHRSVGAITPVFQTKRRLHSIDCKMMMFLMEYLSKLMRGSLANIPQKKRILRGASSFSEYGLAVRNIWNISDFLKLCGILPSDSLIYLIKEIYSHRYLLNIHFINFLQSSTSTSFNIAPLEKMRNR